MGTTQSFNITNNLYNEISGTREEITKIIKLIMLVETKLAQ